jgi:putative sterol carrier protein
MAAQRPPRLRNLGPTSLAEVAIPEYGYECSNPCAAIPLRERRPMATLQELTDRVIKAVGDDSGLGKTVKFDLKGAGFLFIDGGKVSNEDMPADLTMTISLDDLTAMGDGKLKVMSAVMSGKLVLSDTRLAMSLQGKMTSLFSKMT